jgi:hypothetical protein
MKAYLDVIIPHFVTGNDNPPRLVPSESRQLSQFLDNETVGLQLQTINQHENGRKMLLTVLQRREQLFAVFGAPPLVSWLSLRAFAAAVNAADLNIPLSAEFPLAKVLSDARSVASSPEIHFAFRGILLLTVCSRGSCRKSFSLVSNEREAFLGGMVGGS